MLFALLLALEVGASRRLSAAFDEVAHIGAGYGYVVAGDYRLNPEHPPLVKLLAGLATAPLPVRDVLSTPAWQSGDQWKFGAALLSHPALPRWALLERARLPLILLTVAGGAVLCRLAWMLHGPVAALLALLLYAGSPTVLGHGLLVTTDAPMMTLGLAAIWLALEVRREARHAAMFALAMVVALALYAKFNAVLLLPLVALVLGRPRRIISFVIATSAAALVVGLVVYRGPQLFTLYPHGFRLALTRAPNVPSYPFYLMGHFSPRGFWSYYVVALVLKTPLPTIVLILWGAVSLVRARPRDDEVVAALVPGAAWFLLTTMLAADIGLRYLLPAFPFLFLLASRVVRGGGRARLAAAYALALASLVCLLGARDPIAYTNALVPRARVLHYLDDSNVDWGQGLRELERHLEAHPLPPGERLRILYFGGMPAAPVLAPTPVDQLASLALPPGAALPSGHYAISTQLLLRERGLQQALGRCGVEAWVTPSIHLYCCPRCAPPAADDDALRLRLSDAPRVEWRLQATGP